MHDLAPMMWSHLWQATGAIVVIAVLVRLLCRRRPHLAYLLWMVVLVKCLIPPVFNSSFGVFGWLATGSAVAPTEAQFEPKGDADAIDPVAPADAQSPAPAEVASTDARAIERRPDRVDRSTERFAWLPLLLSVWGVGALGLGCVIVRKRLRLQRVMKKAWLPTDPNLASTMNEVADQLGLRSEVRVVITDEPIGPAVFGVLRPTVLLPKALIRSLSTAELRALLAHELTHIKRRDAWAAALQVIVQTVWWFHPLVWWANRQACRERERCCDQEVVARLRCTPASYANVLLKVLEARRSLAPEFASLGIRPVDVTAQRLEDIMKRISGSRRRTPVWRWAAALLTAALLLPGQRTPSGEAPDETGESVAQATPPRNNELGARVDSAKSAEAAKNLRYDRKDFDWWRNELRSELKAELRIEALKAMGAFGANGRSRDAVVAIYEVLISHVGDDGEERDALTDDDRRVFEAATSALEKITLAAPPMIGEVQDANWYVRHFAIGNLSRFERNDQVANALLVATKDTNLFVRREAYDALSKHGARGVTALIAALRDEDGPTRRTAAYALARIGPDAVGATRALTVAAKDPDPMVRNYALKARAAVQPDPNIVVPLLVEALRDDDRAVLKTACELLRDNSPHATEAVRALIKAYSEVHRDDRRLVAWTLGKIGPGARDAIPLLTKASQSEDRSLRKAATEALTAISE